MQRPDLTLRASRLETAVGIISQHLQAETLTPPMLVQQLGRVLAVARDLEIVEASLQGMGLYPAERSTIINLEDERERHDALAFLMTVGYRPRRIERAAYPSDNLRPPQGGLWRDGDQFPGGPGGGAA